MLSFIPNAGWQPPNWQPPKIRQQINSSIQPEDLRKGRKEGRKEGKGKGRKGGSDQKSKVIKKMRRTKQAGY